MFGGWGEIETERTRAESREEVTLRVRRMGEQTGKYVENEKINND